MPSDGEILLVPFFGLGHLFPFVELCKLLASRYYKTTLVISSNVSNSIPSSLRHCSLVEITEISPSSQPPPPSPDSDPRSLELHRLIHNQMAQELHHLLTTRRYVRPLCAVVDVMMGWTCDVFNKYGIPTVAFFTSAACSAAMEYAMWKSGLQDLKAGEIHSLPCLPEEMAVTESDLKHGLPLGGGYPRPSGVPGSKMGPPRPGEQPPWVKELESSIALLINTCDDLERSFINYLADQVRKPVWGVGPLLPKQFYKSNGSLIHDHEIRSNRQSTVTEEEVIQWLDLKTRGSVLYVSFGSEVGPMMEEYPELANTLAASKRPFIWVIQPGSGRSGLPCAGSKEEEERKEYYADGLDEEVGERGLIIRGWAPQLLILSHISIGGFLSHCGWNSTVESIGRGVPILAWPIRGDQHYNAKLLINHLKVGCMISKDDILNGIERLMDDDHIKKRVEMLARKFDNGFPATSIASLDHFTHFIKQMHNIN